MQENLDLDRYPLDKPGTHAWDAMVAKAKAELAETGMFNLPGFLKPAAQRAAVGELAPRFAGDSFTHSRKHNVYFRKEVPGLAADHPALTLFETINKTLCGDQIGGSIKALYEWPPFAAFLAATMDKPVLFTMDDPLARVNAMQYGAGEGLNWHFDRSEFTTTLLLQAPEAGRIATLLSEDGEISVSHDARTQQLTVEWLDPVRVQAEGLREEIAERKREQARRSPAEQRIVAGEIAALEDELKALGNPKPGKDLSPVPAMRVVDARGRTLATLTIEAR